MMKNIASLFLAASMILACSPGLSASNLNKKGKAWLDAHADAAAANVNGFWYAKEWGDIHLVQNPGGRDITGSGDGWDITGVVSGKQVYLLFSSRGNVAYSAVLTSESDSTLNGTYVRGFMKEPGKGKRMNLSKM